MIRSGQGFLVLNLIDGIVRDLMLEPFLGFLPRIFETVLVLRPGVSPRLTWLVIKQDRLDVSSLSFSRLTQRPGGHPLQELQDSVGLDGEVDTPGHNAHDEEQNEEDDPEGSLLIKPVEKILILRETVSVEEAGAGNRRVVLVLSQLCWMTGGATGNSAAPSYACNATIGTM